jgi:hypothetical protein
MMLPCSTEKNIILYCNTSHKLRFLTSSSENTDPASGQRMESEPEMSAIQKERITSRSKTEDQCYPASCHHTAPDRQPAAPPPASGDFQPGAAESGPILSIVLPPSSRRCSVFAAMGLLVAAEQLLRRGAVDWEQEAYPSYDDFLALPFFVVFFPTVRFFLDGFVFEVRRKKSSLGSFSFQFIQSRLLTLWARKV